MLSGKFLFTLIGLVMAIFAICNLDFGGQPVVENWWGGPQFQLRAQPGVINPQTGQKTALGVSVLNENTMGSGKFVQVPSFQAMLSPRFQSTPDSAYIRYNKPSRENLAVPCEPLDFGDMAGGQENFVPRGRDLKEGFCGSCNGSGCGGSCGVSCGKGGYGLGPVGGGTAVPPGYAAGNYNEVYDSLPSLYENMGSQLPVGTMSTMSGNGDVQEVVTFNNLMVGMLKPSKSYGLADHIRGDLAIVPCGGDHFAVHPDLTRDINPGAMNVLAGVGGGGESNMATLDLLVKASGGTKTTFGGGDLRDLTAQSIQQNAQMSSKLSAGVANDLVVNAFP